MGSGFTFLAEWSLPAFYALGAGSHSGFFLQAGEGHSKISSSVGKAGEEAWLSHERERDHRVKGSFTLRKLCPQRRNALGCGYVEA